MKEERKRLHMGERKMVRYPHRERGRGIQPHRERE